MAYSICRALHSDLRPSAGGHALLHSAVRSDGQLTSHEDTVLLSKVTKTNPRICLGSNLRVAVYSGLDRTPAQGPAGATFMRGDIVGSSAHTRARAHTHTHTHSLWEVLRRSSHLEGHAHGVGKPRIELALQQKMWPKYRRPLCAEKPSIHICGTET